MNHIQAKFVKATSKEEYELGKVLFVSYAKAIGVDLSFQGFDNELAHIEVQYGPPGGALFLVYTEETSPVGCFALRKFEANVCELKRMFLEKTQRGKGIGRQMMEMALLEARELGYGKIRLDSLRSMKSAIALYQEFGFKEVEPYRYNPFEDAIYFEKEV
ncbi:MAG: GNAT family N-acetyltransferase [Bacteroidota bacterium]